MSDEKTMTNYVPREMSFLFSSDPANGALNVSQLGSRFTVQLDNPIALGNNAKAPTIEVQQASIWYTTPNISANKGNDQFHFTVGVTSYSFTIPAGLYSVSALNQLISREMVSLGLNADQIVLSADNATQKIVLTYNYADTQVDFTPVNTPREILGFNSRLSPATPSTVGQSDTGDVVAEFNVLNSYLIHSNLTSRGIPINNFGASAIARVPINAEVGRQVNYAPFNPTKSDARELIGKSVNSFDVWLTSQDNEPIDTFGEVFSVLVVIRYWA